MTKYSKAQIEESKEYLLNILKPGDTVWTGLKHVSRSGMSRRITVHHIARADNIQNITLHVARAGGFALAKNSYDHEIVMGGVGMDMGFALVYSLSSSLFPDGFKCTGKPGCCPSNDHTNDYERLSREYAETAEGQALAVNDSQEGREAYYSARSDWMDTQKLYTKRRKHSDGGYALKQRWI
jgi:hypothetical protein